MPRRCHERPLARRAAAVGDLGHAAIDGGEDLAGFRQAEVRVGPTHTRDLRCTVGAAANCIADDNRWATDNDSQSEVDELFALWESLPLALRRLPGLDGA